jgi:hypothetical protein
MITAHVLAGYREAAVRLREAAEWNRFDCNFQEGGGAGRNRRPGRLIPLVDANVVKFFMDPDHEVHLIDSFASLQRPTRSTSADTAEVAVPPHLVTFARVTAEFMFLSSPISIGREVRQLWREVPLITPAHAEETTAMLRRIERKVSHLYERVGSQTEAELLGDTNLLQANAQNAVKSVEELSRAGSGRELDSEALRGLVRNLSGSFEELFAPADARPRKDKTAQSRDRFEEVTALEEALRWMRLIRETKLRPLISHPLCNADVLQPAEEDIRRLAEPLAALKQSTELGRGESSTHVARRAWRDATAVVQTTMLNALARQQGDGDEVRFILISGDDTLHTIYADQFWQDDRHLHPDRYVLRRPLQYIPAMNAKDIPNGYVHRELFDTFMAVLDSVTDFVTRRTHYAFALEHDWHQHAPAPLPATEAEMAPLRKLADLWREVTIASNALSAGLAVHDFGIRDLFAKLDEFAGDKHALKLLVGLHEQIYRDIDGTQLPLIAQEMLTDAVGALRRQAKATRVACVRMPMLMRERFEDVTENIPIERFIAKLADSKGMADMTRLQDIMSRWNRCKVLFFAGAVAAVVNNFERAARHLAHAEDLWRREFGESGPSAGARAGERRQFELAEISYLRCVVDRLRMRDKKLFENVRRRLRRLATAAPKDSFEHARAMAETGTLLLMRYFNVRFGIEVGASTGTSAEMVEESWRFLDEARRVSSLVRKRRAADIELLKALDAQIHTNTIALHVVQSGFFEGGAVPLRAGVDTSLGILENVTGEALRRDHIIGLWDRIASWLTAPAAQRSSKATELAQFCKSRLHALSDLGADYQAPSDAPVFSFIADRAAAEAALQTKGAHA